MSIHCPTDPPELLSVLTRIRKKKADYEAYDFTQTQGRALRAFFDLAQEYETLENFYRVAVFVPKEFMKFDSCLYLVENESSHLKMVCDSMNGLNVCGNDPPKGIELRDEAYETGDSFVTPIRGNRRLIARKPLSMAEDIIGMFEVFPLFRLDDKDKLFFQKYANRIGYNLHYKLISIQNEEHLKFINTLVADIEHNVIVPNMRYKIFLRNLRKKIKKLEEIERELGKNLDAKHAEGCLGMDEIRALRQRLHEVNEGLIKNYEEVEKHYYNTSLFLESLLRRDHFEQGHLVLRRKMCRFKKEIIDPQLERYKERLERAGIMINTELGGVPDEDIPLAVDVGLISQVYANLFSNAGKYCSEVIDDNGKRQKFMSFGMEIIPDFFGKGKAGIKFNVFTTGPHIPPEEAKHLFDEGFRGRATMEKPGTGHGLHFVKKVIEVHGGVVGYEPTHLGNNFYFILPLQRQFDQPEEVIKGKS